MRVSLFTLPALLLVLAFTSVAANGQVARKGGTPRGLEDGRPPLNILSIIPAQGEPGATVTLHGTGFTEKTAAFLGSVGISAKVTDSRILTFDIPDLPPGLYALYVKREDGATSKVYNFTLQAQKPIVTALVPDTVYSCAAGREREVLVSGRNFREGALVLLDGAVITSRLLSKESMAFTVPPLLASGMHQVQIKNPPDELSGALALFINTRPEIVSVSQGADHVSYYDLLIQGRNFQNGSSLVVDGARLWTGAAPAAERERIIYVDCNRIVYQRHPYDSTPKSITIQVINPNGEESPVVTITAP